MKLTRVYRATLNTRLTLLGRFKKLFQFPRSTNRFLFVSNDRCSGVSRAMLRKVDFFRKHKSEQTAKLRDGRRRSGKLVFGLLQHAVYSPQNTISSFVLLSGCESIHHVSTLGASLCDETVVSTGDEVELN